MADFSEVAQLHRDGRHDTGVGRFATMCAEALYGEHRLQDGVSHLVHYTTLETLMSILGVQATDERAAQLATDGSPGEPNGEAEKTYLRLYDTNYSNDPNEGDFFASLIADSHDLREKYAMVHKLFQERSTFPGYVASFVCVSNLREVDDLVFWRTYGKEGRGCALAFPVSCFLGEPNIFRVRYGEAPVTESLDKLVELLDEYDRIQGSTRIRDIERTEELPKSFQKVLSPLVYLCKSRAYSYEKEARIVYPFSDLKGKLYLQGWPQEKPSVVWRHFAQVPSMAATRLFVTDAYVMLGPTVEFGANVQFVLDRLLLRQGHYGPKVVRSDISYRR